MREASLAFSEGDTNIYGFEELPCRKRSIKRKYRKPRYRNRKAWTDPMNVRWAYLVKAANNRLFAKWLLNRCQKSESETTVDTTLAFETLLNCKQGAIYGKIGTTELLALEYSDRIFQPSWPNGLSWKRQAERLFVDSGVFPVSI